MVFSDVQLLPLFLGTKVTEGPPLEYMKVDSSIVKLQLKKREAL